MNDQLLSEIKNLVRNRESRAGYSRFSGSVGDIHIIPPSAKKQTKTSRRVTYSLYIPPKIIYPGPDEKAIRTGSADLPVGAQVTERDKKIARKAPPIPDPKHPDEVPQFLARLGVDDLFNNVMEKHNAIAADSPPSRDNPSVNDAYAWTLGKHLGHELARDTEGKYHILPWSGIRKNTHDNAIIKTVNQNAEAKPGEKKKFTLLMGSPGSGKSTYGTRFTKDYIQKDSTEINPDLIREYISEYVGHNEAGTHRESQLITFGPMLKHAYKNNHHIVLNVPGADQKQMERMLIGARNKGYQTHLVYVDKDPYASIGGTWRRFQVNPYGAKDPTKRPSRFVLPKYTVGIAAEPKKTYEGLKTSGLLDSFASIIPPEVYNREGHGYKIKETSHVRRRI